MFPAFGTRAFPYHAVGLAVHCANAFLAFLWIRRLTRDDLAAFFGAGLYGTTPLFMTAIWQVSATGELLATSCLFLALLLVEQPGSRSKLLAVAIFSVALLSKEHVAFVPACLLLLPSIRKRWVFVLLAEGSAMWLYILASRPSTGSLGGEAYAYGFGANLLRNLMAYMSWSASAIVPVLTSHATLIAAAVVWGVSVLVALRAESRPTQVALAWFGLGILPVLPLMHHTYAHYLYTPFIGFAKIVGISWSRLVRLLRIQHSNPGRSNQIPVRSAAPIASTIMATCVVAILAHHGMEELEATRIPRLDLPYDSMLRKMMFAQRFTSDLGHAIGPQRISLVVMSPPATQTTYSVTTGTEIADTTAGGYRYNFMTEVLDHGRALRALYPQIDTVAFADHWEPSLDAFVVAAHSVDGHVTVFGTGVEAQTALAHYWISRGLDRQTERYLDNVLAEWPRDGGLKLAQGVAAFLSGDSTSGRLELRQLERDFPNSPSAQDARAFLGQHGL